MQYLGMLKSVDFIGFLGGQFPHKSIDPRADDPSKLYMLSQVHLEKQPPIVRFIASRRRLYRLMPHSSSLKYAAENGRRKWAGGVVVLLLNLRV